MVVLQDPAFNVCRNPWIWIRHQVRSWLPRLNPLLHTSLKSWQETLLLATSCQNWSVPAPMSLVWPSTTTGTENICQSSAMSLKTSWRSLALANLPRQRFVHVFTILYEYLVQNGLHSIKSLIVHDPTCHLLLEIPFLLQDPTRM